MPDLYSNAASFPPPREMFDVAVVGGGEAGCRAALDAASSGVKVLLIDENPVSPALIGLDVPLRYGGRATAAVQSASRMVERMVASQPLLAEVFDAGVDVRLGTCVWGAWVPGPASRALPCGLLGLADEERSWLVGFEELVVAAGARDLALGFDGADLPGVAGALGLASLLTRYDAFSGNHVVVLGGGALARRTTDLLLARGLTVVATVDVASGNVPVRALGGPDGVRELIVADIATGAQHALACDTVCLAVGVVPNVEIPAVLGCRMTFDAARGGHVPVLDAAGRTSLPFVRVVGDAAGVAPDGNVAAWLRALTATGGTAPLACICEDVSRADLLSVHPPRYLGASADGQAPLDPGLPPNPDHIKRLTRAGMGVCQGRRCREQVAGLLALDGGVDPAAVPLASYRMPLRPLPMALLSPPDEPETLDSHWPIWFDIPSMFTDHRDIPVEDEA